MKRETNRNWMERTPLVIPEDPDFLADKPVLRRLLANRGIGTAQDAAEFMSSEGQTYDPFGLTGMEQAVSRLCRAVQNNEQIAVYGDYDVDGVTATALLVQVLRRLGGNSEAYIPNRFDEGYGLNNSALDDLAQKGVQLVVTVDCGIRSLREVEHARQLGLDIIISDHHEPKTELPCALAVINPKQPGDQYPEKNLAGVGLSYKIAQGLCERLPEAKVKVAEWLDLVAIGTVADMVPLEGENRTLVKAGLSQIRTRPRQGVYSLMVYSGIEKYANLTSRDIGFALGPRLNASGRLESALNAFNLLMAVDPNEAGRLATELNKQNTERQTLTKEMVLNAESLFLAEEAVPLLIIAKHPNFDHKTSGLVGLVASRLTESYYRPSIVLCEDGDCFRASCRSISEFHITRALDQCSDLMVRHGGHAMAAGFTVRQDKYPELIQRLNEIATAELGEKELRQVFHYDMEISLSQLKKVIYKDLEQLEPTGLGNPGPMFVSRSLDVRSISKMGKDQSHLRLLVSDGETPFPAVAFRMGDIADARPKKVDLLYAYEKNTFNGNETMQLMVRDIKVVS